MRSRRIRSVRDAQQLAKRRVPKSVYRSFSGAPGEGSTLRDNLRAFTEVGLRPHAAVRTEQRVLATTVLGQPLAMPVIVSPVGGLRLAHRDAEPGAARAARAMGVAIGVSTMSSHPIEKVVAAAAPAPVWYQLYLAGGRSVAEGAIAKAREAGCRALVVTVDLLGAGTTPSAGPSPRDRIPTKVTSRNALRYLPELVVRPRWAFDYLRDGLRLELPNLRPSPSAPAPLFADVLPVTATWSDMAWIAATWSGPLVVKGVVRPDDARRAVDAGAGAVVVSNHGGLALDGVPGTLRALPGVVAAVAGDAEVLLDGGVRSGSDVIKALAMGARAVLCGRAYVWGLAAGGSAGVQAVLEALRDDIDRTLAEMGCRSVHDLGPDDLDLPANWPARTVG